MRKRYSIRLKTAQDYFNEAMNYALTFLGDHEAAAYAATATGYAWD